MIWLYIALAVCSIALAVCSIYIRKRKPSVIGAAAWLSFQAFPDRWSAKTISLSRAHNCDKWTDGKITLTKVWLDYNHFRAGYRANGRRIARWEYMRIVKPLQHMAREHDRRQKHQEDQDVLNAVIKEAQDKLRKSAEVING